MSGALGDPDPEAPAPAGSVVVPNALVPDADAQSFGATEFSSAQETKGPLTTRVVPVPVPVALPYIRSPAAAPPFFCVELDAYAPAIEVPGGGFGHGARAHGVVPGATNVPAQFETVRVSDLGYRTREADPGGLAVYPPLLEEAFALDRFVELDTAASGVSVGWGAIRLANPQGQWDALTVRSNSDGRDADFVLNEYAHSYLLGQQLPERHLTKLQFDPLSRLATEADWQGYLQRLGITTKLAVKLVTEAALLGSAVEHGLSPELIILSDGARQFDLLVRNWQNCRKRNSYSDQWKRKSSRCFAG